MLHDPKALDAVRKEAEALLSKGTWDLSSVREKTSVQTEARDTGIKVHLGSLMSICSRKFAELAEAFQALKGRIVYRGDITRDEVGASAIFQDLAASPSSIQATNANIAYGMVPGHKTTAADAVKSYIPSLLKSKHPTWIELPKELWPKAWHGK